MDPASAIGIAGAVIQFLDLSVKVSKRIAEFVQASPGDVPKSFENITTTLPLITNSLSKIQEESKLGEYELDTRTILHGVVLGCYKLTRELEELTNKVSLKHDESLGSKLKKVVHSLKNEDRLQDIDRGLQAFVQVLILQQVVSKKDVDLRPAKEVKYFEAKVLRGKENQPREALLEKIHNGFAETVAGLKETPTYLTLHGVPRAGKSQLALEYCHEAYKLDHFSAVFWLDASRPDLLILGLENAAGIIRQTKSGSSQEKLDFMRRFLADRWHPWLLVLDNYHSKSLESNDLADILPENGLGAILITTQETRAPGDASAIKVHSHLTKEEQASMRRSFSNAIRSKDMSEIVDALTKGFDVNSYSADAWKDEGQRVVNLAADCGFDEAVKLLLELGADPDLDKAHTSCLGNGILGNHIDVVNTVLDHEESTGYIYGDNEWDHVARNLLQKGNVEMLELLLKRRGDKLDFSGQWAKQGLVEAAENGYIPSLRILLKHGKMPTDPAIMSNALCKAVKRAKIDTIKFLLHEVHVDVNALDDDYGHTALHASFDRYVRDIDSQGQAIEFTKEDRRQLVTLLLDAGADPNKPDHWHQNTALHQAVDQYNVSASPLLIERGANVLLVNKDGHNPVQMAVAQQFAKKEEMLPILVEAKIEDPMARKKFLAEALIIAAENGYRELALKVLPEADIDLVDGKRGETSLIIAIKNKQLPMARMLIRKGASQKPADQDGNVALILAAKHGMDGLIKDLVKAKDSPGLEIADEKGFTPLMIAVKARHQSTVATLLALGADRDAMNMFGETALDLAEEPYDKEIVGLLEA